MQHRVYYGPIIIPKQLSLIYTSMYALVTFLMAILSWYVYVHACYGGEITEEWVHYMHDYSCNWEPSLTSFPPKLLSMASFLEHYTQEKRPDV